MATNKQIDANRINAQKSTGPRSAAGKMKSALNARQHGFAGNAFTVVRLEDLDEIYQLRQDALDLYRPVNSQELFALERIAACQMSLIRATRLEAGLFTTCLDKALDPEGEPMHLMSPELAGDGDIEITRVQNRNFALGEGFHRAAQEPHTWALFLRYQAQAERQYRRAIQEFDRLRALRPEFDEEIEEIPNEPISATHPNPLNQIPPPKRTQLEGGRPRPRAPPRSRRPMPPRLPLLNHPQSHAASIPTPSAPSWAVRSCLTTLKSCTHPNDRRSVGQSPWTARDPLVALPLTIAQPSIVCSRLRRSVGQALPPANPTFQFPLPPNPYRAPLTNRLPRIRKRSCSSAACLMPMRGVASISKATGRSASRTTSLPRVTSAPLWARAIASANVSFPGPDARSSALRAAGRRRRMRSSPATGSRADRKS